MSERLHNDVDPIETRDWLQAIESVIREEGVERAQYLIDQVLSAARKGGVKVAGGAAAISNYINSIAVEDEPDYPGNTSLERRIRSAIRWNAIVSVLRASKKIWNWVVTSPPSSLPPPFMKCALTTSSGRAAKKMAVIWFTSRATFRQAFTHVPSLKVV